MVTHLFNAMAPLGHREPGLPGAALADDRVAVGLIADGVHVHPAVVEVAWRAAGAARVALVSDAIAALGMPHGTYPLGATDVEVDGPVARADGRLAGSLLSMDAAVRNLVRFAVATPAQAIASATVVPTRILARGRGRGAASRRANGDLVLLDRDLRVVATLVHGEVVHGGGRLLAVSET
jgi:N-acetylglucosamine-6-phosphate deacetylase